MMIYLALSYPTYSKLNEHTRNLTLVYENKSEIIAHLLMDNLNAADASCAG